MIRPQQPRGETTTFFFYHIKLMGDSKQYHSSME